MVSIVGKKIGMTQIFRSTGELVPVTVIDFNDWVVLRKKTVARDGYDAVVVGLLRSRYEGKPVENSWLESVKEYFTEVKEIKPHASLENVGAGQKIDFSSVAQDSQYFDAIGVTKGRGFQGVVKRHGFRGGDASHGSCLGRIPGSIGNHRSQGRVAKGKKLPGHMGCDQRSVQNLEVVRVETEKGIIFLKGSMPGHAGSLIYLKQSIGDL